MGTIRTHTQKKTGLTTFYWVEPPPTRRTHTIGYNLSAQQVQAEQRKRAVEFHRQRATKIPEDYTVREFWNRFIREKISRNGDGSQSDFRTQGKNILAALGPDTLMSELNDFGRQVDFINAIADKFSNQIPSSATPRPTS